MSISKKQAKTVMKVLRADPPEGRHRMATVTPDGVLYCAVGTLGKAAGVDGTLDAQWEVRDAVEAKFGIPRDIIHDIEAENDKYVTPDARLTAIETVLNAQVIPTRFERVIAKLRSLVGR